LVKIASARSFVLNSEIYTELQGNSILFYNTLTGEKRDFCFDSHTAVWFKKLHDKQQISFKSGMEIPCILDDMLKNLTANGFGSLLDNNIFSVKPFVPKFKLKIMEAFSENHAQNLSKGMNILDYLAEITIYLNATNPDNLNSAIWQQAYKQFIAPANLPNSKQELDFELLRSFIRQAADKTINLNLLGGSVFEYSHFAELIDFLQTESYKFSPVLHFTARAFIINQAKIEQLPVNANLFYTLYLAEKSDYLLNLPIDDKTELVFIIQNDDDFNRAEQYITEHKIEKYQLKPFYNGSNGDFFRENIYLSEGDILAEPIEWRIIHRNGAVNNNYFGKLTVLNNGKVYGSLHQPSVGSIAKSDLKTLIVSALKKKSGWTTTRGKLPVCGNGLYQKLCPPVSNYENAIGKNNLCTVKS